MRIVQISTSDRAGGAEKVAWNLFQAYRQHGLPSWLAVGYKRSDDPDVLLVPNGHYRTKWARILPAVGNILSPLIGRIRGAGRLRSWLRLVGQPRRLLEIRRGHEDFHFLGTWQLLDLPPERPHIVHCHNLHGNYFDLRVLPWLSQQVPTILTLHDAWLLSGHCAHSFDCERWKRGCGHCPDLMIYPAICRDATAYNWQRKREIYAKCCLYVATPSRWLMNKVEQSMLAPAIVEARVIPNGVDLSIFHPADRQAVRAALGFPRDTKILLFAANSIRGNAWKDYETIRTAVALIAERLPEWNVLFMALGEDAPAEQIGRAQVRFIPYQKDPEVVARYYQAADIYLHAAKVEADTFPTVILEALACGTPVVATDVGGIAEQVKRLRSATCELRVSDLNGYGPEEATGMLGPPGDIGAMAEAVVTILTNEALQMRMGENAARDAHLRFDLDQQVDKYLSWYAELMKTSPMTPKNASPKLKVPHPHLDVSQHLGSCSRSMDCISRDVCSSNGLASSAAHSVQARIPSHIICCSWRGWQG